MTSTFSSTRKFEIWRYAVSHGQLLLRSNKGAGWATRQEVLFKDVVFLMLPASLNGLEITTSTREELRASCGFDSHHQRVYKLRCGEFDGFIVAASIEHREDDLEYFASSSLLDEGA